MRLACEKLCFKALFDGAHFVFLAVCNLTASFSALLPAYEWFELSTGPRRRPVVLVQLAIQAFEVMARKGRFSKFFLLA